MRLNAFLRAAGTALILTPVGALPAAAEMDRAEVEKIVREYLLANPEILNEMIAELQEREQMSAAEKAKTGIAQNKEALYNDGFSHVAGNPNGDVTLIEFFDYRCGYCRKVRADLVTLMEQDSGVRLILKELPILSEASHEAAKAAIAAQNQGGDLYWKFHQAMLEADGLDSAAIYDIAAGVGLDVARLKTDMEDPAVEKKIEQTHDLASKIGVDGTPAFIIGDKLVPGALDADGLKELVEAQRSGG
ncbi:MAG: thioredoxin domain-containing protein [Alphaproteobacteria bacterium]|nr:thioredoxin domain-containing protein [Alphaproteobacteria bacterium]